MSETVSEEFHFLHMTIVGAAEAFDDQASDTWRDANATSKVNRRL